MRGKRLSADEVISLEIGTKVVANRTGKSYPNKYLGESVETVNCDDAEEPSEEIYLTDSNGMIEIVATEEWQEENGYEVEYYEYVEE